MSGGILTFTNLYPSALQPTHGLFVQERMARVIAAGGFAHAVVAPVAAVPWPLQRGAARRLAAQPAREVVGGIDVRHPRYRHWPGLVRRQAMAMAKAGLPVVRELTAEGRWVLDAHYLWPDGVAAAAIATALSLPLVLTARGSDVNVLAQDPVIARRIGAAAAQARACFAVSGALAAAFAARGGLPSGRVQVARNGVDLERFRPGDAATARRQLALPADARLLLGVGRLVAGKGFGDCAAALAALPDDVQLVLVGDGPERARIQAAAPPGRVHCLGNRSPDEVAQCYRAADLLVLPSRREGWPNVVTEALASGLRVVASAVGGVPEMLGAAPEPWLGALVPPGDQAALVRALLTVLATPADRARVRAHAEAFGWQQPVAQLVQCFRQLLEGEA